VPKAVPDHALKSAKIGLEMVKRTTSIDADGHNASLQIRVGIHSGSVMAGLVGHDKLIYDIWGQDVNVAEMMEKTSQPSRVHVSQNTFELLQEHCEIEEAPVVTMENPTLTTKTYFVLSVKSEDEQYVLLHSPTKATLSRAAIPVLKKVKSTVNINQSFSKRVSEADPGGHERRNSIFRVFTKEGEETMNHNDRGASFDGIALTNMNNARPDSAMPETPATPEDGLRGEQREKTDDHLRIIIRKLSTRGAEDMVGDHLRIYAKTTAQINSWNLTFRDLEVENEYQMVYVNNMGGKFASAVLIVLFSSVIQSLLVLLIFPNNIMLLTQLLNLGLLIPILAWSSLKFARILPIPATWSESLFDIYSRLNYRSFQFMALISVTIMFMGSFWALIVEKFLAETDNSEVLSLTIYRNLMTSVMTSAAFVRLKSAYMITLTVILSISFEVLAICVDFETFYGSYFESLLQLILILYAMIQVQRRIDLFVRRNYLMKRFLIQNSFEIEDLEAKSNKFLLNLLPRTVVQKLKESPKQTIAHTMVKTGVIFCSICNFETFDLSSMRILNEMISRFDHMSVNYGVEKIKLIGNTYMAASNLFGKDDNYLINLADFALALMEKIHDVNRMFNQNYVLRIGLETGAVVAGVIGKKKFSFDIWGLTVNVASRMETTGIPGKIQVTESVYNQLKDRYQFEKRGEVDVKGRGTMVTYFLLSKKRMTVAGAEGLNEGLI